MMGIAVSKLISRRKNMKNMKLVSAVMGILLLFGALLSGCSSEEETASTLEVVTTTSLLSQVTDRIGGEKVETTNIIPPSQCPGHFDIKPSDVQKLSDAPIFLMHGWQGEMFSQELIASADNDDLKTFVLNSKVGENVNWMSPPVQKAAVDDVVAALSEVDPDNAAYYETSGETYKDEIDVKAAEMRQVITANNFSDVKVMCNVQLTGLIRWMGLDIVSTYGRPDELTPQVVKDLVDTARAEDVVLFIDNLQSGADAALQLSQEVGCAQLTITNFPGGYEGLDTWEETLEYDVNLIVEAISQ